MNRVLVRAIIGAAVLALVQTGPLMAQSGGAVRGIVRDAAGGILPGATVRLANLATEQVLETVTTGAGAYSFPFVPPGEYRLIVDLVGFASFTRDKLTVNVAGVVVLDVTMQVAAVSESITVSGEAPLLQLDTSALGGVVDNKMMTAVPLSSRNFTQVLALSPGVAAAVPDAGEFGRNSANVSASGARPWENSVVLNGLVVDNPMSLGFDDAADKTGVPVPAPDAIQEFRVQTGLYDAEYGRQGGAVVNVITRSGSNHFAGTMWEFFRNDALNANDYFRKLAQQPKPVLRQNQAGGTFGGPIVRNKTFFFISYQGTWQKNGVSSSTTRNVFLPQLGDRSARALGALYGGKSGLFGGVAVAPDGSNINPVALKLLNAKLPNGQYVIPDPQIILPNGSGFSAFSVPAPFREHQIALSFDHELSQDQRVSVKLFYADFPSEPPFPAESTNLPGFGETDEKTNLNLSASHTWVVGPTTVNELRFGYGLNHMGQVPNEPLKASDIGLTPALAEYPGIPRIRISNSFAIGPSSNGDQRTSIQSFEVADTMSLVRGRHSIRIGGSINPVFVDRYDAYLFRGDIAFNSFPDFLLGMSGAQNGTAVSNLNYVGIASGLAQRYPRFLNMAAFFQDDLRLSDRMALNMGVRWQYNSMPWDREGRYGGFDRRLTSGEMPPPEGTLAGFTVPGNAPIDVPPGVKKLDTNQLTDENNKLGFSPRVGLTWRPVQRWQNMVVRGGYGLFWSSVAGTVFEQAFFDPWLFLYNLGGTNQPNVTFQNPFIGVPPISAFPVFEPYTYPPSRALYIIDPTLKQPYNQQWAANVQMQAGTWLLEIGYIGSKASNLISSMRPNQALLASPSNPVHGETTNTLQNINLRVPILGWGPGGISEYQNGFWAHYNALAVSVDKRYAKGLSLRASYTLSRSVDNVNASSGGRNQPLGGFTGDYYNRDANKGLSSFDRPHRFVASYMWELPTVSGANRALAALLNGWSMAGVTTVQSGTPFSITDSRAGRIFGVSSYAQFAPGMGPNDAKKTGSAIDRLNQYFDTSVFTGPPVVGNGTSFGNAGRNILRGPGQVNFDLALSKGTRVGGIRPEGRLELRVEAFNLFNKAQFGNPGTNVAAPASFGVISGLVVAPRIMQLAVKYLF